MSRVHDVFRFSADPDAAEKYFIEFDATFSRTCGRAFNPSSAHIPFLKIFGNSRFLNERLVRAPENFLTYWADPYRHAEKPLATFHNEARAAALGASGANEVAKRLKAYKYREYLRLTIRELNLENQMEVYREFSHLAFAIADVVAKTVFTEICQRYKLKGDAFGGSAIIAMGKLGGLELNYSSDIDIIGLYESDAEIGEFTRHEIFTKAFTRFGKILQTADENGFLYRVDWDLRPEGRTGTLANSLVAMESYYETFGEEWERQAFIKASVLYERDDTGRRFLALMAPFTYRKYLDRKTLERIRDMKSRLIGELEKKRVDGLNIKLCHGGIRDIEFLVQGHQLLHGGKYPAIRGTNTLTALTQLNHHGFINHGDAALLCESYFFWRRLESALQMDEERQTHVLKASPKERLKVARRMGLMGPDSEVMDVLNETILRMQKSVHRIFKEFYE